MTTSRHRLIRATARVFGKYRRRERTNIVSRPCRHHAQERQGCVDEMPMVRKQGKAAERSERDPSRAGEPREFVGGPPGNSGLDPGMHPRLQSRSLRAYFDSMSNLQGTAQRARRQARSFRPMSEVCATHQDRRSWRGGFRIPICNSSRPSVARQAKTADEDELRGSPFTIPYKNRRDRGDHPGLRCRDRYLEVHERQEEHGRRLSQVSRRRWLADGFAAPSRLAFRRVRIDGAAARCGCASWRARTDALRNRSSRCEDGC